MSEQSLPTSMYTEAEDVNTPGERLHELAQYADLHLLVAANPATPADTLKRLSSSNDFAVRRAVAGNPNTALDTLCQLAAEFPAEFLGNPILPLLNITRPDFFKKLSPLAWASLLRFADLSPVWFQELERDSTFQRTQAETWKLMQMHVCLAFASPHIRVGAPGDVRSAYQKKLPASLPLTRDEDTALFLLFVLLFPYTAPLLKEQWLAITRADRSTAEAALAALRTTGARTLSSLMQERDDALFEQIARHPATAPRLLRHLATYRSSQGVAGPMRVWKAVAGNPRTPQETLYRLISSPIVCLRRQAATHRSLERLDLEIMALDQEASVRAALATDHRLSAELFAQLARDPEVAVRSAVARNVKTPEHLLSELAHDPEVAVRSAVASNPRLPEEAQDMLLADPNEAVHVALGGNARLRGEAAEVLVRASSPRVRAALAANPRLPLSLLTPLLRAEEPEVRAGLARHPQLPPALLAQLARQGDLRTRLAVAAHSRTPVETLRHLAEENHPAIWRSLLNNPNTPLSVLELALPISASELLCRLVQHPAMRRARYQPLLKPLAARLAELIAGNRLPAWLRRAFVQYSRALPIEIVACFAASPYWQERYLVARRPHLPQALLNTLANDGICHVQSAARQALERRQSAPEQHSVDKTRTSEL